MSGLLHDQDALPWEKGTLQYPLNRRLVALGVSLNVLERKRILPHLDIKPRIFSAHSSVTVPTLLLQLVEVHAVQSVLLMSSKGDSMW
jgi:hypothetical protein